MKKYIILCFLALFLYDESIAQDDLLSLLGEEETIDFATASFKANRVINLHSIENTAGGVLDFKISHRFGFLNQGLSNFFGLDQSTIRIGLDYGLSDNLMIGLGRSSFEKTVDGFLKYRFLRQSSGKKNMPITAALFASAAIKTTPFQNPDRENYFSSRLYYTYQLIVGRKFSDNVSFQISPTLVHRNLVRVSTEANDVMAMAFAGRVKLTKRVALNSEYIYVLPDQLAPGFRNSFSIGFDIETGGHVFQLHFSNSTSMIEKGFVAETAGNFFDGDIHFGFNISRVFTLKK
ncbi:MAG: hypothetical protein HKO66_16710 [Saprospiraceae bacterium]|nr:hypothetical protein [Bacteroidia bacterium]NNE16616.1 hypothetical protein [Saprospiraceae bacterium]NNL93888.1 hypothetical protein [Saprospiraceae bacterium]